MNLRPGGEKAAIERWRAQRGGCSRQRVAATSVEIRRAASRIRSKISRLRTVVGHEFPTDGFDGSAGSNELRRISVVLREAVGNAVALLAEIQAEAGRLDGIAAMREVELTLEDGRPQDFLRLREPIV
jgi:hypothetical protein